MSKASEQEKLIGAIGNVDVGTEDPCHRCKERKDGDCFILAGKRLRRQRLPDPMRVYILMHLFWLHWPWPVLFLVDFLLESLTPESARTAVTQGIREGLAAMSVKFEGKKVINHHRLGVPKRRELSALSLTRNPRARRDGLVMCNALLKQPATVYKACEAVAADLKRQYSSKRCVSVAQLSDMMAARKVPGL